MLAYLSTTGAEQLRRHFVRRSWFPYPQGRSLGSSGHCDRYPAHTFTRARPHDYRGCGCSPRSLIRLPIRANRKSTTPSAPPTSSSTLCCGTITCSPQLDLAGRSGRSQHAVEPLQAEATWIWLDRKGTPDSAGQHIGSALVNRPRAFMRNLLNSVEPRLGRLPGHL